ncbi:Cytosolic Fe-S cluster assembly factor NARFL [Portunus trituberculatus]|uniref:Cytosolic Fe-S cluster assembly factor NARFL n=1 Tax=Portunus trituberculatus TaxID=210409 RepID=A0A5B7I0Q6_PORTR|nr:Cytosolic Fe-S cluster assembly factor NARFL [Portunus trituberculatus]
MKTFPIQPKYEKAKITLNDCLACSGCITSAEVVLVNQQSHDEFYRVLAENNSREISEKLTIIVSMSPQAVLSIAAKYSLGADECAQKLASKLRGKLCSSLLYCWMCNIIVLISSLFTR